MKQRPNQKRPLAADITLTQLEGDAIFDDLSSRNRVRQKANLPKQNIDKLVQKELDRLADDNFEAILKPYLRSAYEAIPGSSGVANRLKQHIDVYRMAERALYDATGLRRPKPKPMNLERFLVMYLTPGKLPVA